MRWKLLILAVAAVCMPGLLFAQSAPEQIRSLHSVLQRIYDEVLPKCADLINIGRAIAGTGAMAYIGYRVWRHIANAESIDFFPLFRPFVLGFCISIFPQVIALMNGILKPTETGTLKLVDQTNASIERLLDKREKERMETKSYKMFGVNDGAGNRALWMQYTHADVKSEGLFGRVGYNIEFAMSKAYYNLKNWFRELISFLLQLLYEAAALCINTIRIFKMLILAILGPIVFGLAVFDGFQHTLTVYLARYINVFLWLPIANILAFLLGKIQEDMIKLDIAQMQQFGDSFFSTSDVGYIIFMIIGIVCYFTVPSIANMIVNAGGANMITNRVNSLVSFGKRSTMLVAGGAVGMGADALGNMNLTINRGMSGEGAAGGYFKDKLSGKS